MDKILIDVIKVKKKWYVSIKLFDCPKIVFRHKNQTEAYGQIVRYLLGYLAEQIDRYPVGKDKLKEIIKDMVTLFDLKIQLRLV